jgi:ketosteroid isomerase-like protein
MAGDRTPTGDTTASTEAQLRGLLDGRSDAIRARALDRLMSFYSADIVYFDIVPPLRYVGSDSLRARFSHWFDSYEGPMGQEIRDLSISVSGDVACASMLIQASGTLKGGPTVARWVRATSCFRRSDGGWPIIHEHVSLPVDLQSGTAAENLAP